MKIIFMGTPKFAVPSLDILIKNNFDIISVVTAPDKKKGRGQIINHSEIKKFALSKNLNVLQPDNLSTPEFISNLKSLKPDLIVVVAFRILPEEIFTIPSHGSFNLHASLLPKYRGAAPVNWALINGEKQTGVTTFFLEKKVDTGNIILQKKITIDDSDNSGTLHDKLSLLGSQTVLETVMLIADGNTVTSGQDNSKSSPAPKIFKENCIISWNDESIKIHNLIRGLSPYPAAFTKLENKIIKIFNSNLTKIKSSSAPGELLINDKKLFVNTKDFLIEILELQTEGKKRISSADFINGLDKHKKFSFT